MGSTVGMAKGIETDVELYRAFLKLDREHRRRVALRILRNERVLRDLYDHLLIAKAMGERGRSVSWRTYLRQKNSSPL